MAVTNEDVRAFLDRFRTPDEIRDECVGRGVKGVRGSDCLCPVANLIRDEFPEAWGVVVQPDLAVTVGVGVLKFVVTTLTFENKWVSRFAKAFDAGEYPELECGSDGGGDLYGDTDEGDAA